MSKTIRRLAGIRPTGQPHLGHYFSVIGPALESGATVLIAEFHAPDAAYNTVDNLVKTLARFGVSNVKYQSDDFCAELYFRLLHLARVGELERMTQFMTSEDRNNAHLLTYPVLMAYDVFNYDEVFVGDDQTQHLNYARDLLERYNRVYGGSVSLPMARPVGGRVMSLQDPERKMSKSDPKGCLFLDDGPETVRAKVKAAVMTAQGRANCIDLYRHLGGVEDISEMNSEFKPVLADLIIKTICP